MLGLKVEARRRFIVPVELVHPMRDWKGWVGGAEDGDEVIFPPSNHSLGLILTRWLLGATY